MAVLPFLLTGCGIALMRAADKRDSEQIRTLLQDGADVNARLSFSGARVIILAAGNS